MQEGEGEGMKEGLEGSDGEKNPSRSGTESKTREQGGKGRRAVFRTMYSHHHHLQSNASSQLHKEVRYSNRMSPP